MKEAVYKKIIKLFICFISIVGCMCMVKDASAASATINITTENKKETVPVETAPKTEKIKFSSNYYNTYGKHKNQKKYMVISGWAGCGKSTIIKYIIAALPDIDPETDVVYSAITGKACEVMKRKGNSNVSTLHKLLYKTILLPNGSYKRIVKDNIEFKVVIVDECSMVPKDMLEILGRLAPFVIFLGDDA